MCRPSIKDYYNATLVERMLAYRSDTYNPWIWYFGQILAILFAEHSSALVTTDFGLLAWQKGDLVRQPVNLGLSVRWN